jgi:AraC-like DNA-binding protein
MVNAMRDQARVQYYNGLAESPAVRDTLCALSTLAGMAVKLAPLDPQLGEPVVESGTVPLCRLILQDRKGETACWEFLAGLGSQFKCGMRPPLCTAPGVKPGPVRTLRTPHSELRTQECFAGLTELAVPITVQGRPVAALLCGEFFRRKPTEQGFERSRRRLRRLGVLLERECARQAYFETPIACPTRIRAARQLMADIAQHLGEMAAHCLLDRRTRDPRCVTCAKALVAKHLEEMPNTLRAAREANVTEPYFCRMFKAATGMTFSEYVARCHVERARELLHDPNLHVTEVAFRSGFHSIPHFNHTFKRYTGLSPNRYRASLRPKKQPEQPRREDGK